MRTKRMWFMALSVVVSIAACVSVKATRLPGSAALRPLPADSVDVYFADEELPNDDCVRVAVLTGSGASSWTDVGDMLNKMQEEASKLGANVVSVRGVEEPSTGERVVNALFGADANRRADAMALHCPASDRR